MIIRKHVPGYFDIGLPEIDIFFTTKGLLNIPWVKAWKSDPEFSRFSLAVEGREYSLMAEFTNGEFYVLGDIKGLGKYFLKLPRWVNRNSPPDIFDQYAHARILFDQDGNEIEIKGEQK